MNSKRKIGLHLSISGGIYKALESALELDVNAVQFFLKNSNQWKAKPYSDEDIESFKNLSKKFSDDSLFAHSGYLINLAGKGEVYEKSVEALKDEISRAGLLGVKYIVLHPGSHGGDGIEAGIKKISDSLNHIFDSDNSPVKILLETTAGQGHSVGSSFDHIADIIEKTKNRSRVGVCIDTCHIFAAGYKIINKNDFESTLDDFDKTVGLDKVSLIHLNDSKKDYASKVDRHENIGSGFIGDDGFKTILTNKRIAHIPVVLETPKDNGYEADIINLKKVYSFT